MIDLKNSICIKIFIITIVTTIFNCSFSQESEPCEQLIKSKFLNKLYGTQPTDLVPYYDTATKNWGLLDKKSKEILVDGLFQNLEIFNPKLRFYSKQYPNCASTLIFSDGEYTFYEGKEESIYAPVMAEMTKADKLVKEITGFEVNNSNEIIAVNSMFFNVIDKKTKKGYLKISKVFEYDGIHYGVVKQANNYFSIYNEKGEIIKGFEKIKPFPFIGNSYSDSKDLWILAKIDSDQYSFKALKSQKTIQIKASSPACWNCIGRNLFGYQILNVNGAIGLFDLLSMKWKIKPSEENKFHSVLYTSNIEINQCETLKQLKQNRKLAELYLQTYDNTFIDINGNVITTKVNK